MLEVEQDPSSQFVDFTNATAFEQFISDAEQALIAWHLAGKGHASAEALAAGHSAGDRPRNYTRLLEFHHPQASNPTTYALTLFVARSSASSLTKESPALSSTAKGKQWGHGREHFTPTMLTIADATRDLAWHLEGGGGGGGGSGEKHGGHDVSTGVDPREEATLNAATMARDAELWFGVDEFVLVTKTSLKVNHADKKPPTSARRVSVETPVSLAFNKPDRRGDAPTMESEAFDGSMDANEANLVLSAIHLALLNSNCTIPAFVPVHDVGRGTWLGTAVPGATGNVSITFDTDSIPEVNSNQGCISGLLDFFQLKLQLPPEMEAKCRLTDSGDASELSIGTWVSAAFKYSWQRSTDVRELEKPPTPWRYVPDTSKPSGGFPELVVRLFGVKPHADEYWGATSNPVAGIELTTMWPNLREGTYVDNAVHSTLDPHSAPQWTMNVQFECSKKATDWKRGLYDLSRKPTMPLSRVITNLVQAYAKARELSRDVLVSELAPTLPPQPPSAPPVSGTTGSSQPDSSAPSSSRLPESIPAARAAVVFGNAIGSLTSSLVSAATWKGTDIEEIRRVVAEIFATDTSSDCGTSPHAWSVPSAIPHCAPVGELVSVLACRMGQLQGVNAMCLLWVEFVKALGERSSSHQLLPLMSTGEGQFDGTATQSLDTLFLLESTSISLPSPDFHQCLLHQKLQLMNCCILRQAERHREAVPSAPLLSRSASTGGVPVGTRISDLTAFAFEDDAEDDGSPSDDEFFDSIDQEPAHPPTSNRPAAGVLRAVPDVECLLTGTPMMDPVTQVAAPLTEDVAKQQQELLSRLGVGSQSTTLRQQMQSAALVSDMQAFKAANPGSCLADFIRWYSPKDWIAADPLTPMGFPVEGKNVWWFEGKGSLSERMRGTSSHLWHQMWDSSAPIPVIKQKCLFDPAEESEKLYDYLETISPHEMFHQMAVGAISSCYAMLERGCLPWKVGSESPAKDAKQIRLSIVDDSLHELRDQCKRAVALLDEAFTESQVAFPAGRDLKEEQEKAHSQLQVAFEMALDACRTMARAFEDTEQLISQASALLQYFGANGKISNDCVQFVDLLLMVSHHRVRDGDVVSTRESISLLLRKDTLRTRVAAIVLDNPASKDPVQREYVLRCICPRPFLDEYQRFQGSDSEGELDSGELVKSRGVEDHDERAVLDLLDESPVVVNRMYASFTKHTVRFALALAESEF